jgi:glycosyltransferase involved in cell wall biosynthesis
LILSRKKLAIVSSYNENCGNASYTHVLKVAFSELYDVDVIPLDLFLLQKPQKELERYGDDHIRDICAKLKNYDYVNIQFEAGLYGTAAKNILTRMKWLIQAAPNLVLTMHRVDLAVELSFVRAVKDSITSFRIAPLFQFYRSKAFSTLYRDIVAFCKLQSLKKNVWVKVHAKREARIIKDLFNFGNVIHYPLAFLNKTQREELRTEPKNDIAARFGLPAGAKAFGVFGYISNYKGIETAIKALSFLPDDWYLLMVGSAHPQAVKFYADIDPYLESVLDLIKSEQATKESQLLKSSRITHYSNKQGAADTLDARRITDRVKFVGNLEDEDFVRVLRDIDAVVLPYIEVGQSMSGVIVLGLEAGGRIIGANNFSFAETRKYFGDVFERFDIGNYVELAQRLVSKPENFDKARDDAFEKFNIMSSVELQSRVFEGSYKND